MSHDGIDILKGQLQRKYTFLSNERALKMPKNEIRIAVIGQAVLETFHLELDILRKSPMLRIFLYVSIKSGEQ